MRKNQQVQIIIERSDRVVTEMNYEDIKEIINDNFDAGNIEDRRVNKANIEECFYSDTGFAEKLHDGRSYNTDDELKVRYLSSINKIF